MNERMVLWFLYKANQYQLSEESMSLWLDLISFLQSEKDEEHCDAKPLMLPRLSVQ